MTSYLCRRLSQDIYLAIYWLYLSDPTAVYVNVNSFDSIDHWFAYIYNQIHLSIVKIKWNEIVIFNFIRLQWTNDVSCLIKYKLDCAI